MGSESAFYEFSFMTALLTDLRSSAVSGAKVRFLADIDQAPLGIKDPVRGSRMPRKKTGERARIIALRRGSFHVLVVVGFGQCLHDEWMLQFGVSLVLLLQTG